MILKFLFYSLLAFQLKVIVWSIFSYYIHDKCRISLANAKKCVSLCVCVHTHPHACAINRI